VADVLATHLRAGNITVTRIGCTRSFRILIEVYTNTQNTTVLFGGEQDWLDFGDGTRMLVPVQQNQAVPGLNPDGSNAVAYARFEVVHEYSSNGRYLISYREPNRNEGVLNMSNSIETQFYIETRIIIDPTFGCNSTPVLNVPPIDRACPGEAFTHNAGAFDPNPEDVLTYRLVPNKSDRNTEVINYRDPNVPEFYTGNYNTANEDETGPPEFKIDSTLGTITWDAPGKVGEYNIAFEIVENRFFQGSWVEVGYVRRDMQIIVEDCENHRPKLQIPKDTCVVAGTSLQNIRIRATDEDGDRIWIQGFSQIFDNTSGLFPSPATMEPDPPEYQDTPADAFFTWNTICRHVRARPYQVVFKATDNGPGGEDTNLSTFEVWQITVVGPKPVWNPPVADTENRSVSLSWQPYECLQQATNMQIWRKVESSSFEPKCETGMPASLGYELIQTVPIRDANGVAVTSYIDNNGGAGLSPGAQYCYRLVATYPLPNGGESLVSEEICIPPFEIDIPLITKVSVENTSTDDGQIRIQWIEPLDYEVDPGHVLTYSIVRGTGQARGADATEIATNLTVLDYLDQGLNTEDNSYNYSIRLFDNGVFIDESPVASSVWLEAQSQFQRVQLTWSAIVPWSNQTSDFPRHVIYRGPAGATDSELVEIATVDVTNGFVYVDGEDTPLDPDEEYCYKVETVGSYGNPAIPQLIRNFSQKLCARPGDDVPPCEPVVIAPEANRCEEFFQTSGCNVTEFTNTIKWNQPEESCGNDLLYYKIYYSNSRNGTWELLQSNVRDTFYVHKNFQSFAWCYRVVAVDRTLNESEWSDPICFDNCPYFEMPNVFTPNGDQCNDFLRAYQESNDGENVLDGNCFYLPDINSRCPRFVRKIVFNVYNRWGKEVYEETYDYFAGSENSFYINWDGKGPGSQELSSGTYYWVAQVTFDMIDPKARNKTYKGWVQLLRGEN
jgi:hypothetical protein